MEGLSDQAIWYYESIAPDLVQAAGVRRIVYEGRSAFQRVQIIELDAFGRTLVLDGKTQSAEADEWVYHEGLVQPAMVAHPDPRRVFIAGGGEGATAREVLRHPQVTELVMVDLDAEVVALCREHLPNHHRGAFDDPRLRLLHEDALAYLENSTDGFDVIIVDVSDPLEGGPAYLLYTQEFYRLAMARLNPGGLMVTQSGPAGPTNVTETFTAIRNTMASVLAFAEPYRVYVPSFGTMWGFTIGGLPGAPSVDAMPEHQIDQRIAARRVEGLLYYNGRAHRGLFGLPLYVGRAMQAEDRLITRDNPVYAV
jgi:spermidine synthase